MIHGLRWRILQLKWKWETDETSSKTVINPIRKCCAINNNTTTTHCWYATDSFALLFSTLKHSRIRTLSVCNVVIILICCKVAAIQFFPFPFRPISLLCEETEFVLRRNSFERRLTCLSLGSVALLQLANLTFSPFLLTFRLLLLSIVTFRLPLLLFSRRLALFSWCWDCVRNSSLLPSIFSGFPFH